MNCFNLFNRSSALCTIFLVCRVFPYQQLIKLFLRLKLDACVFRHLHFDWWSLAKDQGRRILNCIILCKILVGDNDRSIILSIEAVFSALSEQ